MFKRIIGIMTAAVLMLAAIPSAAFAKTDAVRGEGILWDFETDPMMHDFTDYGFLPVDNDGDGNGWGWSNGGEFSHYEGNGCIYSLSSLNGAALTPDNLLFVPAFTGTSFSFYANQAFEGHSDVLAVWLTYDGENYDEVFRETLSSTEPACYTIELDSEAPYASLIFRHYQCSGEGGVVVDYVSVPDGAPYTAPDEPYYPEVPDGMIPIDGAEAFGLTVPEFGALSTADITVPEGVPYHVYDAYWMESNQQEGWASQMAPDDVFNGDEGGDYYLCIELEPDDGYWFDLSGGVTLDGSSELIESSYIDLESGILSIESIIYSVESPELELIDAVNIDGFEPPVVGATAADCSNVTVPEGANYEIINLYWCNTDEYEALLPDQTFEEGAFYSLIIKLRPLAGYGFSQDTVLTINAGAVETSEGDTFILNSQVAYIASIEAQPTAEPVQPTEAPADPTAVPVDPTSEPVEPTEAPADPTGAPADPTPAPVPVPPTGTISLAVLGIAAAVAGAGAVSFRRKKDR